MTQKKLIFADEKDKIRMICEDLRASDASAFYFHPPWCSNCRMDVCSVNSRQMTHPAQERCFPGQVCNPPGAHYFHSYRRAAIDSNVERKVRKSSYFVLYFSVYLLVFLKLFSM